MDEQWHERPMIRVLLGTVVFLLAYAVFYFYSNKVVLWFDVAAFFLGLFFWLFFFAQFILPERTLFDRLRIFWRVILYILGGHGPALFIENGAIRESTNERLKQGPGVIWLDSASAAVLRNKVSITRVVGPGVVFTQDGEYIAGAIDLHKHAYNIGPSESERPFDPKREPASGDGADQQKLNDDYTALQERRWQTRALTRDGIEVCATIGVNFGVLDTPNDGGSKQFPFSKNAVRQYVTAIINASTKRNDILWSDLPAQMAADLWRDYLRRFTLDELFQVRDGETRTGLQIIGAMINQRLGNKEVDDMDAFGVLTGKKVRSLEGETLAQMGMSAKSTIKFIHLPNDVQERLLQQWPQDWLKNAQRERKAVEQRISLREREGKNDAIINFATDSSLILGKREPYLAPPSPVDTLIELLRGTRQGIERGGDILRRTSGEIEQIEKIREWLLETKQVSNG